MEILFEILFQIIGQIVIEILLNGIALKLRDGNTFLAKSKYPVVIYIVLLIIGSVIGGISTIILPNRILPTLAFNGISILIAPLVVGFVMMLIGIKEEQKGKVKTKMLTFWGGFIFTFGTSVVRWILVNNLIEIKL